MTPIRRCDASGVCTYTDSETGVVTPVPVTAAPARPTQGGNVVPILDASGSASPTPAYQAQPTTDSSGQSGGGGKSYGHSYGHSYGGGGGYSHSYDSGGSNQPKYADGTYPGQSRDLGHLGDRIRGAVGADGSSGGQRQVYVPGGAAAGPYETRAAGGGTYGADRAFNSSGHPYGGGGGGGASDLYWKVRNKLTGAGGGGSSYGGSSYGGSSSYASSAPYEPPPIDPVLNAASHLGSMQALMAVGLEGLPSETQEKYTALGNMMLAKWGQKALKNPEKANKKAPHVTKKLMR